MQKKLRFMLAALTIASISVGAQAATIAAWGFESNVPANFTGAAYNSSIAADIGSGSASGVHAGAATAWSSPVGNGSAHSFSSNTWAVGDYYQFSVSTSGYTGITLSWDQASSSTGPRDFKLAYSTDGISFTDFATYTVQVNGTPNTSWNSTTSGAVYSVTENLSSIAALNNQTQVLFRLIDNSSTAVNGSGVATAGTDRVDNFSVSGVAAVPVPATAWLLGSSLLGLAGITRKRKIA